MSHLSIARSKTYATDPFGPGGEKMTTKGSLSNTGRWKKILCSIGTLLFLLMVSNAAWSQKTPDTDVLLGERHKAAGIGCVQCHKEKPSAPVSTGVCSGCHPNVAKSETIRETLPNPHNAHMPFPDCTSCHHAHKSSENQCRSCHKFDFKMR